MKKQLLTVLTIATVFSCKKQDQQKTQTPPVDYAIFSGEIQHFEGDGVQILQQGVSKTLKTNADGTFRDTLRIRQGTYIFYDGQRQTPVYIAPGYTLHLSSNAKQLEKAVHFTGKGAVVNNYLAQKSLKQNKDNQNFKSLFALEEKDFITKIKSIREEQNKALSQIDKEHKAFIDLEQKSILYTYYTKMAFYPRYHKFITKNSDFKTSAFFDKEMANLDFSNEKDYKENKEYKMLLNTYFIGKFQQGSTIEQASNQIKNITSSFIKEDLVKSLSSLISSKTKDVDLIYKALQSITTDSALKQKIDTQYNAIKSVVVGSKSPSFSFKDKNEKTIHLADFKGKYVYIDIWATWCKPCLGEIPALQRLEKKFHGKNIAFVSISVDKAQDKQKWQNMIKEKALTGTQLFADNAWNSTFIQSYSVQSIPRFILLDPRGYIVETNAKRPSDPALLTQLQKLVR